MTDRHLLQSDHSVPLLEITAAALGVAAAIAAWVMPFTGLWLALTPVMALCAVIASIMSRGWHPVLLVAVGIVGLVVLAGIVPLPMGSAGLGLSVLLRHQPRQGMGLSLALLGLQLSFTATPEALVSNALAPVGLEAAAAALIGAAFLAVPCWRQAPIMLGAAVLSVCGAAALRYLEANPVVEAVIAGLPLVLTGVWLSVAKARGSTVGGLLLCLVLGLSWIVTPPRLGLVDQVSIILPADRSAPEAPHFRGIAEALRFSGLLVEEPTDLKDIGRDAVVVLPWLSTTLREDEEAYLSNFRTLANERRWTVVMFGEHDAMGNLDARTQALVGHPIFHRNLTVPPGNGDSSGPLRAADVRPWPVAAMLNRGASTNVFDARARVLLSGDGWWADPDLREWLWTGDYRWRPGDRGGRLVLAHTVNDAQGATWVAIGDTTPILTRQLIADPRPVRRLLDMATLLPAFLMDVGLVLGWLSFVLVHGKWARVGWAAVLITIGALGTGVWLPERYGQEGGWRTLNIGESGYEASNFNASLAAEPRLLDQGWELVRLQAAVTGQIARPSRPTVSFLLVDGSAEVGDVRLSACWRLGNLNAGDGKPWLMDAQACRIDGTAEVLVGEPSGAAVVMVRGGPSPWIIVLDRGFLSESAPPVNAQWLLRAMAAVSGG